MKYSQQEKQILLAKVQAFLDCHSGKFSWEEEQKILKLIAKLKKEVPQ